jgi:O-acetyl-ADP-ribose deacetylase (regulator of RNase III)
MAAEIAVRTVKNYLTEHPDCSVKQVVFNVFKDVDKGIYQQIL